MAGLNKVQIIGNLGADPDMRYTTQGTAVTNFRVAVSRRYKDNAGNLQEETEWFRVVAWDKLAQICNQYLNKGKQVYVEGRLQTRKYTDREGIERTSVEIVALNMVMLGGRGDSSYPDDDYEESGYSGESTQQQAAARGGSAPAQEQRNQPRRVEEDMSDDDIPF